MERLKSALEDLDEALFVLEDRFAARRETKDNGPIKKQGDSAKQARGREVEIMAVAQKVAARLDHTIEHVERILHVE